MIDAKKARTIGNSLGADFTRYTPGQLARGIRIETSEHRDVTHGSYKTAARIAMSHLRENPHEYNVKKHRKKKGR